MASQLVLLFDTDHMENVLDQLGKAIDAHSPAEWPSHGPQMILVRKEVWLKLEMECARARKSKDLPKYDIAYGDQGVDITSRNERKGYNAIIVRGRPVVPMPAQENIVADRLGAND